jgi:hypothetical protein
VRKIVKYNFASVLREMVGRREIVDSILNFKYFIPAVKFRRPIEKL